MSSPRIEEQSQVLGTVAIMEESQRQPRYRLSSDGSIRSHMTSGVDSGYDDSLDKPFTKRSMSAGSITLSHLSRVSVPNREEHKPDGI